MILRSAFVRRLIPQRVYRFVERLRNRRELRAEERIGADVIDTSSLIVLADSGINDALRGDMSSSIWNSRSGRLDALSISTAAGGVNPGDRRALYQLISHLRPVRVLEVGTHIGASTVYLADAMDSYCETLDGKTPQITTVDIIDVNDHETKPWIASGADQAPSDLLDSLGLDKLVEFVARPSLDFLRDTSDKFDLIFLDGDHRAKTVYKELPAALNCMAAGGCIILHDYFPDGRPLWSNGAVVSGPFLAIERLQGEGLDCKVLPLGELPWQCKLGSNVTSLAIVGR